MRTLCRREIGETRVFQDVGHCSVAFQPAPLALCRIHGWPASNTANPWSYPDVDHSPMLTGLSLGSPHPENEPLKRMVQEKPDRGILPVNGTS